MSKNSRNKQLNSAKSTAKTTEKHSKKKSPISRTESMIQNDSEIKSFIYQQIAEFHQYVTPTTVASVVARDPMKLNIDFELSGDYKSSEELSRLHRIAIYLRDDDTQIHEEAYHENIYEAIRLAKEKLLAKLVSIQDQVISKQDRISELAQAMQQLH